MKREEYEHTGCLIKWTHQ